MSSSSVKNEITAEYLREQVHYDSETGVFIWKAHRKKRVVGAVATTKQNKGYLRIYLDGKNYYAHRMAWLYVFGSLPKETIDHKNGNRSDNRICNLREASLSQNLANRDVYNRTGSRGVSYEKRTGKYTARITVGRKDYFLGTFDSKELAAEAFAEAAKNKHGEFASNAALIRAREKHEGAR